MAELAIAAAATQFLDIGGRAFISVTQLISDIGDAPRRVVNLQDEIGQLYSLIKKIHSTPTTIARFHTSANLGIISDAVKKVEQLQKTLDDLSAGPRDCRLRRTWLAARIVLGEKELNLLCEGLERHKTNLLAWLGYHNLEISLAGESTLGMIVCGVDNVNERIDSTSSVCMETNARTKLLSYDVARIEASLHHFEQKLDSSVSRPLAALQASVSNLNSLMSVKAVDLTHLKARQNDLRLAQSRLESTPSELRLACDTVHGYADFPSMPRTNVPGRHRLEGTVRSQDTSRTCCCRYSQRSSDLMNLWPYLKITWTTSTEHERSCPCIRSSTRTHAIGLAYIIPTWLLGRVVEHSFSITYGAGGLSISPAIATIRVVNRKKSALYALIETIWDQMPSPLSVGPDLSKVEMQLMEVENMISKLPAQIRALISAGMTSPSDVDEGCQSILHDLVDMITVAMQLDSCTNYRTRLAMSIMPITSSLAALGFRFDARTGSYTPFDLMLWNETVHEYPEVDTILYHLYAVEKWPISQLGTASCHLSLIRTFSKCPDLLEYSQCAPIANAILKRAEGRLKDLLRCANDVNERDQRGWTPLHCSVYWPAGMRILLAAGANLNPWRSETMSHGFTIDDTPLSLAIAHRQDEAVLMLLDADCALYSPESSSDRRRCKESILSRAMRNYETQSIVFEALVRALVNRRTRLRSLAREWLTHEELQQLGILAKDNPAGVLDEQAAGTVDVLESAGIAVPDALKPDKTRTVFDVPGYPLSSPMTPAFADFLYIAGFQAVNVENEAGFTPIHEAGLNADMRMVAWFLEHGVDPATQPHHLPLNTLHLLVVGLRRLERRGQKDIMKFLDTSSDEVCARLAADSSTSAVDRCRCACSMGGCTPSIMLIRGSKLSFHRKWALLRSWSRAFEGTSDISNQCWLEVARLETFQQLQLTHVCCGLEQDAHQHKMNSEQDEIQQEESVLIEQLESWMIRFQEEKIKFRGSMATFTDTWLTMMRAELGYSSEHGEWAGDTVT